MCEVWGWDEMGLTLGSGGGGDVAGMNYRTIRHTICSGLKGLKKGIFCGY
jgi:hypothetical protein